MIREMIVRIKTVFQPADTRELKNLTAETKNLTAADNASSRGAQSVLQAYQEKTVASQKAAEATRGLGAEQRKAIEVSQKLTAASRLSSEGIFGIGKAATRVSATLAKLAGPLTALFTGWQIGTAIYEKIVKGWIARMNAIPAKLVNPVIKTREELDKLNNVEFGKITGQFDKLATHLGAVVSEMVRFREATLKLIDAETDLEIKRLHKQMPEGPQRDEAEARLTYDRDKRKAALTLESEEGQRSQLLKIKAANDKAIADANARLASETKNFDQLQAKLQEPGAQSGRSNQLLRFQRQQAQSARNQAKESLDALKAKGAEIETKLLTSEANIDVAKVQKESVDYTKPGPTQRERAIQITRNRVNTEGQQAGEAQAAARRALFDARLSPADVTRLQDTAKKEAAEYHRAQQVLAALLSGNERAMTAMLAHLERLDKQNKTLNAKLANLPTS